MGTSPSYIRFLVNFLLGVSWAIALAGAIGSFFSFYHVSFFLAIISVFIGMIPGLIAVLLLEHFITSREKLEELRKQTALLEEMIKKR